MKPTHTAIALVTALLLALSALTFVPRGSHHGREQGTEADAARIRAHLERVEREPRARDVSHLTPA